MAQQTVVTLGGEIFLTRKGKPYGKNALLSLWRRALPSAAKKTKIKRLDEIPPHRLRSTFATMAARLGVEDRVLKSYLGHAPTDILGAHYRRISDSDLGSVSSRMNDWRSLCGEVDQEWQDPGSRESEGSVAG